MPKPKSQTLQGKLCYSPIWALCMHAHMWACKSIYFIGALQRVPTLIQAVLQPRIGHSRPRLRCNQDSLGGLQQAGIFSFRSKMQ